jgi:hypothetical protein
MNEYICIHTYIYTEKGGYSQCFVKESSVCFAFMLVYGKR